MCDKVSIFCSNSSFEMMKNFPICEESYGCITDLSYGDLDKDFLLIDNNGTSLSFDQLFPLLKNKKIKIWFNSKNSCEYCNFHYLITKLPDTDLDIIDTSYEILLVEGSILSVPKTEMMPINYFDKYVENVKCLKWKEKIKYKNNWLRLYEENSELRYCVNGEIFSVNEDYFDEMLENEDHAVFHLMLDFGLSEDWLVDRKKRLK